MRLKDIMSTKVESIGARETLEHAQARMKHRGIHHLVVMDRERAIGVLSAGDVATRLAEGVERVEDGMSRRVTALGPETTVEDAARLMRERNESAIPVVDGPCLVGIVTISDLLDLLARRPRFDTVLKRYFEASE